MNQLSILFQTLGTITQLSDKITTILIAVIAFFLLDKQFQFSENYRQNELHGRLKDLLAASYIGNDTSKRVPAGAAPEVLENEFYRLEAELSALRSAPKIDGESKEPAKAGDGSINGVANNTKANKADSSQKRTFASVDTKKCDNTSKASPEDDECLKCFRIPHCVLTVLTSGFWFLLYGFASFFYIFIRKITPVKEGETSMSWSSAGVAAIAVVALLGPFVVLAAGFAASLPEFYSPIFNYVLNIAISGFLLQAVAKVFGSFFLAQTTPAPAITEKNEATVDNQEGPVEGNFWDRLRWLLGFSSKK